MQDTDKKSRRQSKLVAHLQAHRFISLDDIASRFSVTTQTARRDLMELENAGIVRRLHGGAMLANGAIDPPTLRNRRVENAAAKDRIAAKIADLVVDGSSIFLDTGTTCEAVARALTMRRNLRTVTYGLRAATTLCEVEGFSVAVPGGFVRNVDAGVFRHDTVDFIGRFKFDIAIISVSSIDADGDMCDDDHGEVQAVHAAMRQAEKTILAVDQTKFLRRALVRLGSIRDVDLLVTDSPPATELSRLLTEAGVTVVLV
ncbi:MAG: DeoR/GlpR transcriptional regulator [Loktanella sp.]|nr:DeoR/GlpR transcriptional regulator [Loktanella sp.]